MTDHRTEPEYLRDDDGRIICTVPIDVQAVQYVQIPHLRTVCSWCTRVLEVGSAGAETTHVLCARCAKEQDA